MATMTQLFKIVSSNDYDTLEKLIMSNKKPDFNCIKSGTSLISKAIEVRALECFNLLMGLNDLTVLKSNNTHINGLDIALEYYSSAPNPSNKYFLDKLIEHYVSIDCWSLVKCMDDKILFELMFNRLDKTYNNMNNLICSAIKKNEVTIMNKLYDYLYLSNPQYYSTPETKNTFNDCILKSAIQSNNIIAIEYLETLGHNIMSVNNNSSMKMPSLYYAYISNTDTNAFNFIFSRMEKMDKNALSEIPSITKLSSFTCSPLYNYNVYNFSNKNIIECLKKILLLPIEWEDLSDTVTHIYVSIYKNIGNYYYNTKKICEHIDEKINHIYMILNTKKLKTNPYNKIELSKNEMTLSINNVLNKLNGNPQMISILKSKIRKIKYVLNNFGFKEPDSLDVHFKLVFDNKDSSIYDSERLNFTKEIEEWFNKTNEEKKVKVRVSRKKKTSTPLEIDV